MSRASEIRSSEWGAVYLKSREVGDVETLREALRNLRQLFAVDDRVLLQALNTGSVQGSKRGRPQKPKQCPHCGHEL